MAVRTGNNGNNNISGTNQADRLLGNGGNDRLSGLGGSDYIDGGNQNDYIDGGYGNDRLYGGLDRGVDRIFGGVGNDIIEGGGGNDFLSAGRGADNVDGGRDNDIIYGGQDNSRDILRGSYGRDTLIGESGADYLDGFNGRAVTNIAYGVPGEDLLQGNNPDYTPDGYTDTFALGGLIEDGTGSAYSEAYYQGANSHATIADFALGEDLIQLAATNVVWTEDDSSSIPEIIPTAIGATPDVELASIKGDLSTSQYNSGSIEDFYQVSLNGGFTATTVGNTSLDTVLTVYDLSGNVIDYSDDSSGTTQSTLIDNLTGDYIIGLRDYSATHAGTYSIDFTGVFTEASANYDVRDVLSDPLLVPDYSFGSAIYYQNDLIGVVNDQSFTNFNLTDTTQFTYV